ncbi:MAG: cytochrome-c peroxidase, partial [Gemmatimonadaceae bacterium]
MHKASDEPAIDDTSRWLARAADSLDVSLVRLAVAIDSSAGIGGDSAKNANDLRHAFAQARTQYKHMEGAVEFYAPALAASLNSRRQEVDDDDAPPPSTLAPGGFPALEGMVWPALNRDSVPRAHVMVDGMRRVVGRIRALASALAPTDAQVIELARLEMTRIATLGIAGFDAPVTHASMTEAADALDGLRQLFANAGPARWPEHRTEQRAIDSTLNRAASMLRAHPDFDSFDRLLYITSYAEPAALTVDALRKTKKTTAIRIPRGWRSDVASVFGAGAFDPRAYAAATAPSSTPALVALGERLFSDPALSGNGKRSCASCHVPSHAFTDGLSRAVRIDGHGLVARHTPTLLNAALASAQFADERSVTIEEQIVRVLESEAEMGSSIDKATAAIAQRHDYVAEFSGVFGGDADGAVTESRMRFAIAAFVR